MGRHVLRERASIPGASFGYHNKLGPEAKRQLGFTLPVLGSCGSAP